MYIVGFFAPIFIPCVLFQVTKSYFDAWLKLMISYALQPTVLAAFIALMFTTFDQTMYGDCTFTKTQLPAPMRTALASVLNPRGILFLYANATTDGCKDSPGYRFNGMTTSNSLTRIDLVFFNLDILNNWTTVSVFPAMFKMFVVGFLFWHFSKMLGAFASDLTGGPNMSALAVAPTAFAKLAAKVAVIAARVAAGDAEGAAKDVASEVKQGAEDSAKPDDKDKG
jgi:type IV secretion system protein VirB6